MREMLKQFIGKLKDEDRQKFGKTWEFGESKIIPILQKRKIRRKYIVLAEAKDVKISDTGVIDSVYIKNNENKPILICQGDIFEGKTQERASIRDVVINGQKGANINVHCVHASKGINSDTEMSYSGKKTPYNVSYHNQADTWGAVSAYCNSYYCVSSVDNNCNTMNDDIVSFQDETVNSRKKILASIPPLENQVGIVMLEKGVFVGLEIFDSVKSWEVVKKDIIGKEGALYKGLEEDGKIKKSKKKSSKDIRLIRAILSGKIKITEQRDDNIEFILDDLYGNCAYLDNGIIHLTLKAGSH